ncbi:4-hydroxybenzoate 3-monooxygenase [Actinomycetes bacterium KLBMP 9797]
MAESVREVTTVAIIGAGPAGLTLANLLCRSGVDCMVLERQSRSYIESRQRAGVLDRRAGRMFAEWGLADQVLEGTSAYGTLEIRTDGEPRYLDVPALAGGQHSWLLTQQVLVRRLLGALEDGKADLRMEADVEVMCDLDGDQPMVRYRDRAGDIHEVRCDYVAGCDGFHGASRRSVPAGALTTYTYDHGVGWITVLAEAPPPRHPLMAISRHGYAAQFPRGAHASRYYLQCPVGDGVASWPDEKVWCQLRLRLGDEALPDGVIVERAAVEMRSFVVDPMSYGRLFLVGDAAHLITPLGGKGMNLALGDADVLARALCAAVLRGDDALLRAYSSTCLRRIWNYQEFSRWMTEMVHDAGDASGCGPFRRELARARLARLFDSPPAATAFATLLSGVD